MATKVRNKNPSPIQISSEQILRDARHYQESQLTQPPKCKLIDHSELADYQLVKRKEFEHQVRCNSCIISVWVKYAIWEESQKDFRRSRSIWERALEKVDRTDHTIWLKYAEFEMRNKFLNHARNVWGRAITLLPRVDQLWYKYIHMEEMLGNVAGARQLFERWVSCVPTHQHWLAYIKFELRYKEVHRARQIFERLVQCYPNADVWIKFAKFEFRNGDIANARVCYERAVQKLVPLVDPNSDDEQQVAELVQLLVAFGEFEEGCKEIERARRIYKFGFDHIIVPKGKGKGNDQGAEEVFHRKFVAFQKQYGDKHSIEDAILGKRRLQYHQEVQKTPFNYDSWFDYIRLEEQAGNKDRIREVYEQAIAHVPPAADKCYWQGYIYLWINYALYEELDVGDVERTREVYRKTLGLVPHNKFSFAKIWLLAAQFEIRQKNLEGARKILGNAIGRAPKDKIFQKYIEMELQLGNISRCRTLYEKYLEWDPESCYAWSKYIEMEVSLGEAQRARAIFELAIAQPAFNVKLKATAAMEDTAPRQKKQCLLGAPRVVEIA